MNDPTSYINKHTIQGMLSKRYKLFDNGLGFIKNKNNAAVFFPFSDFNSLPQNKIYITYLLKDELEEISKTVSINKPSKSKMILSQIDKEFLDVKGSKYKEIRETRNKYDKIITIKTEPNNIDDVMILIDLWKKQRRELYGWQEHSGYDRNFFSSFWEKEKDDLFSYFFYLGDKLVGYSIISKLGDGKYYNYVIRKNDTSYRNLCLYIDFKSFNLMFDELGREFVVNWGAASGSILKYKRKFPVYKEIDTYFTRINK